MEKGFKRELDEQLATIVDDSLKNNVFTACSVGYWSFAGNRPYTRTLHFGTTDRELGARVNKTTMYDLASLTKPLVTTLALAALVAKGALRLEDPLTRYVSDIDGEKREITLAMLLSHSSGLPAHRPFFKTLAGFPPSQRKNAIIGLIDGEELLFQPGCGTLYSDLGFILLGRLVEKVAARSLAAFWQEEIAQPLGLENELFYPGEDGLPGERCAATGMCSWSGRRLCGVVHDDNCRMLGGVAGHAGLFGTASGVLSLVKNLFMQYRGMKRHPAYDADLLRKFMARRTGSTWAYGFDTPSPGASSSGQFFSPNTVGHLGFTGTSFWLDLARGVAVVLLTNRVIMGDDPGPIRKFRPLLHDTIMKHLTAKRKPD